MTSNIDTYLARDVNVPKGMIEFMRSNHAGETGAVAIYKGAMLSFWSRKIRRLAADHIATELAHLEVMSYLVPCNEKSKLLIFWSFCGFTLGLLSSLLGYRFFCHTVAAVETFVEEHYQQQINYLNQQNDHLDLLRVIKKCQQEEVLHKCDALKELEHQTHRAVKFWYDFVGSGSRLAVNLAKKV